MYSRITMVEIDTMRIDLDDAVELFRDRVLPGLRDQGGYEGSLVLTTPDGKGLILTMWETEAAAVTTAAFAGGELERYMTLFRAPPGREHYEVVFAELPAVVVA